MGTLVLPELLQARLDALPQGLQDHIGRVRGIARELAAAHAVDEDLAELTAAAHDVARHIAGARLIEEAERLGIAVNAVERSVPILLHGPVGAAWLAEGREVADPGVLEGVRWHTTAHPDLAPVGQIVFIADKLDPHKAKVYPFQAAVREAALRSLEEGALVFLDGMLRQHLDRGDLIHPLCTDTRNALVLAAVSC
jgi:predicted HD superfamily hydrolase involved in NAD metabolism